MEDLVAHTAKVKRFGHIGAVSSNLQCLNLSASTSKYIMVDVADIEDFVYGAVPTSWIVESDRQRSTTLVSLAEPTMYQPQTSAMIKNQRGNLLNSQVPPKVPREVSLEVSLEVPKYHNSTLGSQELFSAENDIDAFEILFLESIRELEGKAFKFQGKENTSPSITLSAENLKIIEANKHKALDIKKKKADEYEWQKNFEQVKMQAIEEKRIKVLEFERQQAYELQKLKFLRAEAMRATELQKL